MRGRADAHLRFLQLLARRHLSAEHFGSTAGRLTMNFLDSALSLITLASLFIIGPAVGYAVVSCFNWQNWPVPIQHLVLGICTMVAVSAMMLAYGILWERRPTSAAWYGWIQELPPAGKLRQTGPVEIRQPPKK